MYMIPRIPLETKTQKLKVISSCIYLCVCHTLKMVTFLKILSILLVLSIYSDVLHIKDVLNGGEEIGNSLGKPKYSLLLPGASAGLLGLSKSAIKAAKKLAKALAKKKGIARNKQKNKSLPILHD